MMYEIIQKWINSANNTIKEQSLGIIEIDPHSAEFDKLICRTAGLIKINNDKFKFRGSSNRFIVELKHIKATDNMLNIIKTKIQEEVNSYNETVKAHNKTIRRAKLKGAYINDNQEKIEVKELDYIMPIVNDIELNIIGNNLIVKQV